MPKKKKTNTFERNSKQILFKSLIILCTVKYSYFLHQTHTHTHNTHTKYEINLELIKIRCTCGKATKEREKKTKETKNTNTQVISRRIKFVHTYKFVLGRKQKQKKD